MKYTSTDLFYFDADKVLILIEIGWSAPWIAHFWQVSERTVKSFASERKLSIRKQPVDYRIHNTIEHLYTKQTRPYDPEMIAAYAHCEPFNVKWYLDGNMIPRIRPSVQYADVKLIRVSKYRRKKRRWHGKYYDNSIIAQGTLDELHQREREEKELQQEQEQETVVKQRETQEPTPEDILEALHAKQFKPGS